MIICENPLKKPNKISRGSALVAKNHVVLNGCEHFYQFVGRLSGLNFLDLIHPDHLREFRSVFDTLKPGDDPARMLILVKNCEGEYYWTDMTLSNSGLIMVSENTINIDMFFITATESRLSRTVNNLNKYRVLLSIQHKYLFDYDTRNGNFTLYFYQGTQATSIIKCNIDEARDNIIMPHLTEQTDKDDFQNFYKLVTAADKSFSCNVMFPISVDFKTCTRFTAHADLTYTEEKEAIVTGILYPREDETETSIPYYATSEAIDPDTGLLNKRASHEYTNSILSLDDNLPHYMVVIDIDNFKNINDNYGHMFGDDVLNTVANALKSSLNGRGVTGRFGGDEFYVFTNNIKTEEELRVILTTIRRDIYYAYDSTPENLNVTLSVGVSLYPDDGKTYDELFKKADKCLYIAKNKGRNRFIIYDEAKHGSIVERTDRTHKILNLSEHAEYMANIISDKALLLSKEGPSVIPDILSEIFNNMEMDGARIYEASNPTPLYTYGNYKVLPDLVDIFKDSAFISLYNKNNMFVSGNTVSMKALHAGFYEAIHNCNILAFTSYRFEINNKTYYFFYDVFNHTSRWNDSDKNYLLIISKLIANIL